jgi:Spy/CpxP family protein refolding chaperone
MKNMLKAIVMLIAIPSVGMAQAASGLSPNRFTTLDPPPGARVERRVTVRFRGPMMRRFQRPMMRPWWENPFIARRIGLTAAQRRQLGKISFQSRLRMIDLRAALEKERLLLQPMLQSQHPNQSQVLTQIDKIGQARTAVLRAKTGTMLAVRNVLTPEQWQKLRMAREWGPRMMAMRFRNRRGARPPAPPKR